VAKAREMKILTVTGAKCWIQMPLVTELVGKKQKKPMQWHVAYSQVSAFQLGGFFTELYRAALFLGPPADPTWLADFLKSSHRRTDPSSSNSVVLNNALSSPFGINAVPLPKVEPKGKGTGKPTEPKGKGSDQPAEPKGRPPVSQTTRRVVVGEIPEVEDVRQRHPELGFGGCRQRLKKVSLEPCAGSSADDLLNWEYLHSNLLALQAGMKWKHCATPFKTTGVKISPSRTFSLWWGTAQVKGSYSTTKEGTSNSM